MYQNKALKFLFTVIIFTTLNSCSEYWWTRGQPPSPSEILKRAQSRVEENKEKYSDKRPEISKIAEKIVSETSSLSSENLTDALNTLENTFTGLEGQLSYGSRPPFNELSGQLRAMKENSKNGTVSEEAVKLYFARVLFFLSSEMRVPAPDPIQTS